MDTIAAISTAPGEAGIAIIRISGGDSLRIADVLFRGSGPPPSSRPGGSFLHGHVVPPGNRSGEGAVDEVILLVYRAPHSYTREDVIEIQGHGGRACARRILRCALDAGARDAEPGEFTKRAFLNGRIDLLQAEAVADLVRATSDRAASAALQQLDGELSHCISTVYDSILDIAADLEATLDFAEDELPEPVLPRIAGRADRAAAELGRMLSTWEEGRLLREGALVVICGRPNVGKSTLLNRLLGTERAIVTHTPGTTRDTIEESLVLDGVPLRLVDTAGLRETECHVEREGVQRAHYHITRADLVIHVVDGSEPLSPEDRLYAQDARQQRVLIVLNKADLGRQVTAASFPGHEVVESCLLVGKGVENIKAALRDILGTHSSSPPHAAISERHKSIIQGVLSELNTARKLIATGREDVVSMAASTLRLALEKLGPITGRTYSDELIDKVFSRFCIGK